LSRPAPVTQEPEHEGGRAGSSHVTAHPPADELHAAPVRNR